MKRSSVKSSSFVVDAKGSSMVRLEETESFLSDRRSIKGETVRVGTDALRVTERKESIMLKLKTGLWRLFRVRRGFDL